MPETVLSTGQQNELMQALQSRFAQCMHRHKGLSWAAVAEKLVSQPGKLWTLYQMETTGGEPDVVGMEAATGAYFFYDCAPETPKGRRSLCYDRAALDARKAFKPNNSAVDMAAAMGIELLSEAEYRVLQALEPVDAKTSSWLKTPSDIRKLGGAIFGDFRFGRVFVYHNGAESYYGARGFRGVVSV
ncbi:MAG: DUF4256 domain-containing protein [Bacteroidetes bacterium]|nr:MAG: DUF4256 domain-containing protein [Bacteroidota bacterium]